MESAYSLLAAAAEAMKAEDARATNLDIVCILIKDLEKSAAANRALQTDIEKLRKELEAQKKLTTDLYGLMVRNGLLRSGVDPVAAKVGMLSVSAAASIPLPSPVTSASSSSSSSQPVITLKRTYGCQDLRYMVPPAGSASEASEPSEQSQKHPSLRESK